MAFRDYEEFIAALNAHGVRYLIAGAHAVAFHARPRATKDLDVFFDPDEANAAKVLEALQDFFGGADLGYDPIHLTDPNRILQIGVAPSRIDLLPHLIGLPAFEVVWQTRVEAKFGSVEAHYLGLEQLIRAKEAAGREQDRADLVSLRRTLNRRQPR